MRNVYPLSLRQSSVFYYSLNGIPPDLTPLPIEDDDTGLMSRFSDGTSDVPLAMKVKGPREKSSSRLAPGCAAGNQRASLAAPVCFAS